MSEMEFFSQDTVTADDVAAAAGVSRWTVARAFKKDASISRKSRQKVIEAAERLGYVPDLLASSLASDRSNLVALVADDFTNPHKLVMLERLTRILRKRGWGFCWSTCWAKAIRLRPCWPPVSAGWMRPW